MSHAMSRSQAAAIRAVGLSAGAILLLGSGALAISAGADPASIRPAPVEAPPLPEPQEEGIEVLPYLIAEGLSSAYRHDFTGEPEPAQTAEAPPAPPPDSVRLLGAIGAGEGAVAVIGVGADQLLLGAGESGPDFRVEEVHPDRIVINRGGREIEIALGERQPPLAGDISPGRGMGGAGAGSQSVVSPGQTRSIQGGVASGAEDDGLDPRARRRLEMEERQRAATRALEASGGAGNGFGAAANGLGAAGNGNGNMSGGDANGPTPATPAQTQTRARPTRPAGGNGASNN